MKNYAQIFFVLTAGLLFLPSPIHAQSYSVSGFDATAGGGTSSNVQYSVNGKIAQLSFTYALAGSALSNSVVTWSNPASISYGTPLGASQLNATANVPGAFAYNPPAGTVLLAGSPQALSVTFTPANTNNYNGATATVALSVLADPLTITATSTGTTYGAALPSLTVAYAGFVNGDTAASLTSPASLTTTAALGSPAGVYPITAGGAIDPNYSISYVTGALTVSPAPLTITANSMSKIYGAGLPALTASYAGFVNGDTLANLATPVSLTTTASAGSPAGTYPIGASGASSPNYTVSFVSGSLAVTPAALTISANSTSKIYGAALPVLTASYAGFVNGNTAASLATPVTLNTTATASSPSGVYPITASGASSPNYAISFVNGSLTVSPFVASGDNYSTTEAVPLSVPAPGVLTNDSGGSGSLTALLVSAPTNGSLTLNPNGSFLYTPGASFVGQDSFSYKASDGSGDLSAAALVNILVTPSGDLFSDDFPGSTLSPWTVEEGTWSVANGSLNGSSAVDTLGYAYLGTNWTNYTVQANVRFSMTNGPWGGGIGGRLNTATGAHYGAWVYPEGSGGGSCIMNLIKWETWGNWSRIPMAQAKLPGVGTNWHTVTLSFQGSTITASYDGTQEISVTDNDFSSMAPLASGGITADEYTYQKPFTFSVANVVVSQSASPLVAVGGNYIVTEGAALSVAAPGVLVNDSGGNGSLTALLVSGPANGSLTLNSDGSFLYTPGTSFVGQDSFSYKASDGSGDLSAAAVVSILVTPAGDLFSDDFPGTSLSPWTVEEGTWTVANEALNGSSAVDTLGYAYLGTNWTNYTVQASVRFSMTNGPWGGGIGGRLNTATGAHYGAWVYPEGSGGGSCIMNLIKWETWGNWSRIPMAQAKLPGVGTNWHIVTLSFQGSNITASYDGTQEISVTDKNFSAMAPLPSGGITADEYTYQKPFTFSVANVVVSLDTNAPAPDQEGSAPNLTSTTHSKAMPYLSRVEIDQLAVSPGGQVHLSLRGQIGQPYLLEMSTDLIRWQVLATGALPSARFLLMDPNSPPSDRRFYRVSSPRESSRPPGLGMR